MAGCDRLCRRTGLGSFRIAVRTATRGLSAKRGRARPSRSAGRAEFAIDWVVGLGPFERRATRLSVPDHTELLGPQRTFRAGVRGAEPVRVGSARDRASQFGDALDHPSFRSGHAVKIRAARRLAPIPGEPCRISGCGPSAIGITGRGPRTQRHTQCHRGPHRPIRTGPLRDAVGRAANAGRRPEQHSPCAAEFAAGGDRSFGDAFFGCSVARDANAKRSEPECATWVLSAARRCRSERDRDAGVLREQ